MPRGVYDRSKMGQNVPQEGGVAVMNNEELQAVVDKNKDKVSPFTVADMGIKAKHGQPVPGTHRVRVGNFTKPALIGDPNTLKTFAHTPMTKEEYLEEGWIPMTWEEMYKYQEEAMLVGWDADEEMGLLKKQKIKGRVK